MTAVVFLSVTTSPRCLSTTTPAPRKLLLCTPSHICGTVASTITRHRYRDWATAPAPGMVGYAAVCGSGSGPVGGGAHILLSHMPVTSFRTHTSISDHVRSISTTATRSRCAFPSTEYRSGTLAPSWSDASACSSEGRSGVRVFPIAVMMALAAVRE